MSNGFSLTAYQINYLTSIGKYLRNHLEDLFTPVIDLKSKDFQYWHWRIGKKSCKRFCNNMVRFVVLGPGRLWSSLLTDRKRKWTLGYRDVAGIAQNSRSSGQSIKQSGGSLFTIDRKIRSWSAYYHQAVIGYASRSHHDSSSWPKLRTETIYQRSEIGKNL